MYYQQYPISESDLQLMRRIDKLHLDHPFAGARMLRGMLRLEKIVVGRKHISTLMKKMGIEALYHKANNSRRNQAHRIYPYLLRHLTILIVRIKFGLWIRPTSRCNSKAALISG